MICGLEASTVQFSSFYLAMNINAYDMFAVVENYCQNFCNFFNDCASTPAPLPCASPHHRSIA